MPKDLEERRGRCLEWMGRPSPTTSPNGSDNEGEDEDEEDNNMDSVIAGLLGLSSTTDIPIGFEGKYGRE